jgi:hypothetical protein
MYSQIPTSGDGDFTVTRNTTATRLNDAGLIESVASGIPRLDYFTSGGVTGCPALLVEPAATNLCLQSEAFNTTWTRVSGGTGLLPVITANAVVAPDGTTTADTVVFDRGSATSSSANFSQLEQVINFPTSGTYTFGVYAKATAAGDVGKQFYIRTRNTLVAGSLTSSWVRYTSTETGLASGSAAIYIGNRGGFTADQSVSVDLWGAQLETGSVATSYIPTTAGTGSRSADVISVSGAVSGSIGQTEGTLYAEIVAQPYNGASFPAILQVDDGADSQRFAIFIGPSGGIRVRFNASGVNTNSDSTNPATLVVGQTYKIAAAFGFNGSQALYINGVFQVSGSVTAGPFTAALNRVMLGHRGGISSPFLIRSAALYNTRLTNTELAALTTP